MGGLMAPVRKWGPWAVLLAVAVAVMVIGLHRGGAKPGLDAQVEHISSEVRCPVCHGETVAQSQAAPSVEIRNLIRADLQKGESEKQILASIVASYGPGILEKPQAKGVSLLVWVLPVVGVILAAAGLTLAFRRWRAVGERPDAPESGAPERGVVPAGGEGVAVEGVAVEGVAVEGVGAGVGVAAAGAAGGGSGASGGAAAGGGSGATGGAAAGGVAPRTVSTAAAAEAAVVAGAVAGAPAVAVIADEEPSGTVGGSGQVPDGADGRVPASGDGEPGGIRSRRPKWTRVLVAVVGVALVAGGTSWAVVASSATRLPGQGITGQALGSAAEAAALQAAQKDEGNNDALGAIKEYQKVLNSDPKQVQALAGEGWLLAQTGQPVLLKQGLSLLESAEQVQPDYAPAHVYRGIALLGEGDYGDAIPELQWYLDHSPDPRLVPQVRSALAQAQAKQAAAAGAAPSSGGSSGAAPFSGGPPGSS